VFAVIKVNVDPVSSAASTVEEDNATNTLFIAVGTGVSTKMEKM
jgi:hypothetical protein